MPEDRKFNPKEFVTWINNQPLPRPDSLFNEEGESAAKYKNHLDNCNLTDFRPNDTLMQVLAKELNVRIVHGHEGIKECSLGDIVVLNARKKGENNRLQFIPVAACIGGNDYKS